MIGIRRRYFLLVIAATLGLAVAAWAEKIFPVNDPGNGAWVFDQPSVVANGTVLHVAFVGDNAASAVGSPNTRLFYAAINGAADFTNKLTVDNQVRLTAPFAIDNTFFNQARHPQIEMRSATELAILFQAIPSDNAAAGFKLFSAVLTIGNNAVVSQRVNEILDAAGARLPGSLTDPSFGVVVSDNTLRVAYSSSPSLLVPSFSDVYYARVGWDNARVMNNTILLDNATSTGRLPLPRLRLDGNNNSHVVWAANDNTTGAPSGIYYAMVNAIPPVVVDNLAIGATQVLSGGNRWGFPNVLLANVSNQFWVLAADEPFGSPGLAGSLGITLLNPYGVTRDGNPVSVNNVAGNSLFFLNPPGGSVLSSDFDAYHPEASIDGQFRMHVAGYGFRDALSPFRGTPGRFYAMSVGSASASVGTASVFASMVSSPVPVGLGDIAFAMQIPGDYTRSSFAHLNGKAVHFWSGPDNVLAGDDGARNLYVTSALDSPDNAPVKQSGCSIVGEPRRGEAERIPGAAVLLLPAVLLALRRATRKAFAR